MKKQQLGREDVRTIYAKKLKLLRTNGLLTQREMALKFKICQQGYAKLENGKVNFTLKKIEKICKVFKISFDDFISIKSKPKKIRKEAADSYNIRVLKLHYERLLLQKDIRIGQLEIELIHHKKIRVPGKKAKEIRVLI